VPSKRCPRTIIAKRRRTDRVRVHFLGVRGSTPAPGSDFVRYGGHTSCIAITRDGEEIPSLILDAGTGIRLCSALCGDRPYAGTILLGHLHWDHLHGLPFFRAGDREDARIDLYVPQQSDGTSALDVLVRGMSPPHFPIRPDELRGQWTFNSLAPSTRVFEGFTVVSREIPHKGGRTFGYRVSDANSTLTYMSDHCPSEIGPGPDGWGEYHDVAMELARDTDLLIHDSQLVAEEHAREAVYGHAAAEYAVELGRRANAQRVALFHHRPDRTDEELDLIGRRFESTPHVVVADQSMVMEL